MAAISKELQEMSQQPWFPIMMRELGYEPIKHGRWIEHHRTDLGRLLNDLIECSECGVYFSSEHMIRRSYCPNCGAIMDEQQEAEK